MKYIIQPVELLLSQNVNIMDVIHDRIFKGYDKEILQYIVMKYIRNIEPSFETVIEYSEMRNQLIWTTMPMLKKLTVSCCCITLILMVIVLVLVKLMNMIIQGWKMLKNTFCIL